MCNYEIKGTMSDPVMVYKNQCTDFPHIKFRKQWSSNYKCPSNDIELDLIKTLRMQDKYDKKQDESCYDKNVSKAVTKQHC